MKIVNLGDGHALLIKGWFRKKQAKVYESSRGYWRYEVDYELVSDRICKKLNRMFYPEDYIPRWERGPKLPRRKLLTPGEE